MTTRGRLLGVIILGAMAITLVPGAAGAATDHQLGPRPTVSVDDPTPAVIPAASWRAYRAAIVDSTTARPREVVDDLLVPTPADPRTEWRTIEGEEYLLVGLLRRAPFSGVQVGDRFTLDGDRWVSVPGELDEACPARRCSRLDDARLDQRLKQVLGLPPDADYRYVLRFWVRPADLFRPCTDPRMTSSSCPEQVPTGTAESPMPEAVGGTTLAAFLWTQANYAWRLPDVVRPATAVSCAKDWQTNDCLGFPWTRLGYTYDWSPRARDEMGVTEFVAVKGATAYLAAADAQRAFFPAT